MVTHTITIRLGTRFDSNEIHKILLKICREFNWNLKKNFSEADIDPNSYISRNGKLFVATVDGKVVGTIGYFKNGNVAMLIRFYVLPEFRRIGIGTALYNTLIKELRSNRIKILFLGTSDENLPHLYSFLKQDHYIPIVHPPIIFPNESCPLYYQIWLQ